MNTTELVDYLRVTLLDDQDAIFATDANINTWLKLAYADFRRRIEKVAPEVYEISYTPPTLTGVFDLPLAGVLFGATPSQRRCQRMTRVEVIDSPASGQFSYLIRPAPSFEVLRQYWTFSQNWWLDNTTLRFNWQANQTIRIWYLPEPNVNFLAVNGFIDDAEQFHDVIALLAARQYAIKSLIPNPALELQLQQRLKDLSAFYRETRSGKGSRCVRDSYPYPGS